MISCRTTLLALFAGIGLAAMPSAARADLIFGVTLDTSPLAAAPGFAPYTIVFSLTGGPTGGGVTNTVTLSNFTFGGGSPVAFPSVIGDVTGDLSTTVTLTDSTNFTNLFFQDFVPGSQLSFTVHSTTNVGPPGATDRFAFGIADVNGILPTTAPDNALVAFDITSTTPTVEVFPTAPGADVSLSPAQITFVPEPSSLLLLGAGVAAAAGYARRRRAA